MTAYVSTMHHSFNRCSCTAAACTSARIGRIMDTAIILVVSIIVLSLRLSI